MSDAASSLGAKLESLYGTLPPEEQRIVDFLLEQAAEQIASHGEVEGFALLQGQKKYSNIVLKRGADTSRMEDGGFGGLATPDAINALVATALDANLFPGGL